MDTTSQTPSIIFPTPRFNRSNLTSFDGYISYNRATISFNDKGNTVPLLSLTGNQTLFLRFTHPQNDPLNMDTIAKAAIAGTFKSLKYNIRYVQNIGQNMFWQIGAVFLNNQYNNIEIMPLDKNNCPLSLDQIDADRPLKEYLEKLNNKLALDRHNECTQTLIGPLFTTFGYTNSWMNFQHLDFIDISVQLGLWASGTMISSTTHHPALIFDPYASRNIGFPIMANITLGFYDWLNIGGCALVIPFKPSYDSIINNTTVTKNLMLIDQITWGTIKKDPFVYFNGYLEADQMIPLTTFLIGFSYMKQHALTMYSDQNKLTTQTPSWEICNMTIQAEFDFTKQPHRYMPRIKFIYVCPLWGKNVYKTTAYAAQIGLEISYTF